MSPLPMPRQKSYFLLLWLEYVSFTPSPRNGATDVFWTSIAQNTLLTFVRRVNARSMRESSAPIRNAGTPFVKPYAPYWQAIAEVS